MRTLFFTSILFCVALFSNNLVFSQGISGVRFEQNGQKVDINYNIDNASGQYYNVKIYYSTDGGENFYNQVQSASGDIGKSISAGKNKKASWDVLKDLPQINSDQVAFKVVAAPKQSIETFEVNDCLIELTDCKREGKYITLYFTMTNNGKNRDIGFYHSGSFIYDSEGVKHTDETPRIEGTGHSYSETLSGITIKSTIKFEAPSFSGDKIVAAKIKFRAGKVFSHELRNIPIQ